MHRSRYIIISISDDSVLIDDNDHDNHRQKEWWYKIMMNETKDLMKKEKGSK